MSFLEDDKYREWVREEARWIDSDGCTKSLEIHKDCCLEHDLAYFYGRDPRWAFLYHSWSMAPSISRAEADKRFWDCNGLLYRYVAVRLLGGGIWRRHRKLRP